MRRVVLAWIALAGLAPACSHATGASEWTQQRCIVTAGGPGTTSTAAVPHFCYGTYESDGAVTQACARFRIDFNRPCAFGIHPLLVAASGLNEKAVVALLDAGADVKVVGELGQTALHGVANGCSLRRKDGEACRRLLRLLVSRGGDLNRPDISGTTPFWMGIHADMATIDLMIDLGADIDRSLAHFGRPLDFAYEMKNRDLIAVLERRGAKRGGLIYAIRRMIHYFTNFHIGS